MKYKDKEELQKYIKKEYNYLLLEQKLFFEKINSSMKINNHHEHYENPDYFNILLSDIRNNPEFWQDKVALDFGCGCGRNLKTLLDLADWKRVDGVDISRKNIEYSSEYVNKYYPEKCLTFENNGYEIKNGNNEYDFIMSTIVFQHIPSYEIRYSILMDMFDLLKKDGLLSIQFADMSNSVGYFENKKEFDENNTNSRVDNINYVINDLKNIGFKDVQAIDNTKEFHCKWYFLKATK
jgi:2-polyprenyl-3-methyl-5-hydroxy-6-metoxy-1,4-benzoquinol methylase